MILLGATYCFNSAPAKAFIPLEPHSHIPKMVPRGRNQSHVSNHPQSMANQDGNQKLSAVGIRVSHWITYHRLALNVTTDLTPFNWIVPCGIRERQVGSVKGLLSQLQSSISNGTADLHHPDDASIIDVTYKSLVKEFLQAFELQYLS